MNWTSLHTHSQYSLLDGLASPLELAIRAKELKMGSIALTDHGSMYGIIDFYTTCKEVGIKPIVGMEAYIAIDKMTDKKYKKSDTVYTHLTLLAKNNIGYHNLLQLSTIGFTEGFYYRPRIDFETLFKYKEGIIVLSGCMFSALSRLAIHKDVPNMVKLLNIFHEQFGEDFYVEVQDFGLPEQQTIREILPEVASSLNLPVVATNDIHYVNKEDSKAHEVLLCVGMGQKLSDPKRLRFDTSELYMKSYDEMNSIWPNEYLDITNEIADKCNVEIELNRRMHINDPKSAYDTLARECQKNFERNIKRMVPEELYKERLSTELIAIETTEYAEYIMVVADFIKFAKMHDIPVGSGRGSSAGSLVCYLLGITDIDPIQHDLLFERFINTERVEPPDIDVDICQSRRKEVLEYLRTKYGNNRVAQITSFGSMKTRAVLKDVCRVLEVPPEIPDTISKMLGYQWEDNIFAAFNRADIYAYLHDNLEEIKIKEIFDISSKIENKLRHSSTHAAGVVISDRDLIEVTPLCKRVGSEDLLTQYDMDSIAKLGLLKFDILGLRTLTVIHNACKLAGVNPDDIPLNDPFVYRQLCKGQTIGIFQYEGYGYTKFIKSMQPQKFEDLVALGALYRPGPLNSGMANDYVNRMHGNSYINEFPGITDNTYGILLYQEQIMKLAVEYAGLSMNRADTLRKAIGKKDNALMKEMLIEFKNGMLSNGINKSTVESIVLRIVGFARYGWNKAHAVSYAMLSYRTAWLRVNQPLEFWCAMLNSELDDSKRFPILMNEAHNIDDVKIAPPHINLSEQYFTLHDKELYAGLLSIKGIGEKVCGAIISERANRGPFKDVDDLRNRIPPKSVNCRALELLINSGAFREVRQLTEMEKWQKEMGG